MTDDARSSLLTKKPPPTPPKSAIIDFEDEANSAVGRITCDACRLEQDYFDMHY